MGCFVGVDMGVGHWGKGYGMTIHKWKSKDGRETSKRERERDGKKQKEEEGEEEEEAKL